MNLYDKLQAESEHMHENNLKLAEKFKTPTLEEVREMTNESDMTSDYGYDMEGMSSEDSFDSMSDETLLRVKIMEEVDMLTLELAARFRTPPVPFIYELEDFDNCKLNSELKKVVAVTATKLPVVSLGGSSYLVGAKTINLELKNKQVYFKSELLSSWIKSNELS